MPMHANSNAMITNMWEPAFGLYNVFFSEFRNNEIRSIIARSARDLYSFFLLFGDKFISPNILLYSFSELGLVKLRPEEIPLMKFVFPARLVSILELGVSKYRGILAVYEIVFLDVDGTILSEVDRRIPEHP